MAHYLVYWKTFWEFNIDKGKYREVKKSYTTGSTGPSPGDVLWIFGREQSRSSDWKLLQKLVIRKSLQTRDGKRHLMDVEQSQSFPLDMQSTIEPLLKQLSFKTRKPITESGTRIGRQFKNPTRPLSAEDVRLLTIYATGLTNLPFSIEASDEIEEAYRRRYEFDIILRNRMLVKELKASCRNICQICSTRIRIDPRIYYSEVHHLKPLGNPHNGPDTLQNMICVCPNCHVKLDYAVIPIERNKLPKQSAHIAKRFIDYHNALYFKK